MSAGPARATHALRPTTRRWVARLLGLLCATAGVAAQAQQVLHFEHLTVEDGLTDSQTTDFAQDRSGFVWIATSNGLNRFDGREIRRFIHDRSDPYSLPHNNVRALAVDHLGQLWVGTRGGGLARYDEVHERFAIFRSSEDDPSSLSSDVVEALASDGRRGLWVATRTNGLSYLDIGSGRFQRFVADASTPGALRGSQMRSVAVTSDGQVWAGGQGHGLYRFIDAQHGFHHHAMNPDDATALPDGRVTAIHQDPAGTVWIATQGGLVQWLPDQGAFRRWTSPVDGGGIASPAIRDVLSLPDGRLWLTMPGTGLQLWDPRLQRGALFKHQPSRRHSPLDNEPTRLFRDRGGVLWLGSGSGVSRLDPTTLAYTSFAVDVDAPTRLPSDDLWGIEQTADDALWLATADAGVVRFDPSSGQWRSWRHDPRDPASLASDRIYCMLVDRHDRVWVGTADAGLDLYDPTRDRWIHHRTDPRDPDSISRNSVFSLREAGDGDLLIGLVNGFDRLDPDRGVFSHLAQIEGHPDGGFMTTIFDLVESTDGTLWLASFIYGIRTRSADGTSWAAFAPEPGVPESLGSTRVNALLRDRAGSIWAGTEQGLYRHLGEGNRWRRFGREHGLSTENVSALLEDRFGAIWIGTSHGLNRLAPDGSAMQRFFAADGLPSSAIGWHGLRELKDGRIAVATARGFALFDPADLPRVESVPQVALTGIELFNRPVPLTADAPTTPARDALQLAQAIAFTEAITLNHRQNVVGFTFAGLDFARPEAIRYRYRLEGWDADWLETTAERRIATYTNLPGGSYRFHVRAANGDGEWSAPTPALTVIVKPPPWRSPWAYAAYALAIATALFLVVRNLLRRAEVQRLRAEREAEISERLRRVDQLRDEFLANTSHELRTPLHGIIGIAESLSDGAAGALPENARRNLQLIVSSGRRLSALVNDILDFSSLRNHSLSLSCKALDLRPLVDVVLTLSQPLVGSKPVRLLNHLPRDLPLADADEARVQQILHNLIGNAIKFTARGEVAVEAEVDAGMLQVSVRDTGIGIAAADQERIFESFEQAQGDATREYGGTGLGLSIARQLVELHGGTLGVRSTPGAGSTFTFTLPLAGDATAAHMRTEAIAAALSAQPASAGAAAAQGAIAPTPTTDTAPSPFTVLVVDDDPVNRQVLVNQLSLHRYRVVEAADGEEALARVAAERPDLVLLDVMMPRMSGYDVCRMLREQLSATQMPVIYLTARSQVVDVVTGFETGANDFLTKPVARGELLARVRTQLELLDATRNLERKVAERTEALRRANDELQRLASLDGLTRIPNRRSFDAALARLWDEHLRSQEPLALLIFDIDHFKRYNDHYGHQGGDEALIAVAQAAARALHRPGELAARYGGEEFAILLPRTDRAGARQIAEQVLAAVSALQIPHAASDTAAHVSVSIGVAVRVPEVGQPAGLLVERADHALYAAKRGGRNRVAVDEVD